MWTKRGLLFANGYRFLIGSPGTGKSKAINLVRLAIEEAKLPVPLSASSVTRASFVDDLSLDTCKKTWGIDGSEQLTVMSVLSSEYGSFIGNNPGDDFYRLMSSFFDGETYRETRRSQKGNLLEVKNPYISMLTGTQPEHFAISFPQQAWRQGYTSRCDFYYAEELVNDSSFYDDYIPPTDGSIPLNEERIMARSLGHDVQVIMADLGGHNQLAQQVTMAPDARLRYLGWVDHEKVATDFTHPWMTDYNVRRPIRLRRDCLLYCIMRGDTQYIIELQDVEAAIALHAEQDAGLQRLMDTIVTSEHGDILKMTYDWACRIYFTTKRPLEYSMVLEYVMGKVKIHESQLIMKHLVDNEVLLEVKKGASHLVGVDLNYAKPKLKPNPEWVARKK